MTATSTGRYSWTGPPYFNPDRRSPAGLPLAGVAEVEDGQSCDDGCGRVQRQDAEPGPRSDVFSREVAGREVVRE